MPIWLVAAIAALGAVLLFIALDGQRRARTAPATEVDPVDSVSRPSPLPPLLIFDEPTDNIQPPPLLPTAQIPPPPAPPPFLMTPAPADRFVQPPVAAYTLPAPVPSLPAPIVQTTASAGNVLVIDTTSAGGRPEGSILPDGPEASEPLANASRSPSATNPIRTTREGRRSTIVPQGTLIPAVLETALDSTRPGQVRAVVSRDVKGADGTRVLIPRGSRLLGQYEADLKPGQNRALVQWTRLVRPDGVSIAIDSPAADTLGRAGVPGRVDNHFLERFGSALVQTTLNFGAGLAGRSINGDAPVIVALPGFTQGGGALAAGTQIQPTLRVDAGTTVSVFVCRDLEFPPGELRP